MKKIAAFVLVSLFAIITIQQTANAFQPSWLSVKVINSPDDLVFVDILVPKSLPEIQFGNVNQKIISEYPDLKGSQLVGLDSGGYVSYSLYFEPAYSELVIRPNHRERSFAEGQLKLIERLKIVTLNENGDVLKTSDPISLVPDFFHLSAVPTIEYDYGNNSATVIYEKLDTGYVLFSFLGLISIALPTAILSLILKLLASLPFRIKPVSAVLFSNVVSQPLVALGVPLFTALLPFATAFVMLVAASITIDILILLKTDNPKNRTLLYISIAGIISILFNLYVFGSWYGFFRFTL